MNNIWSGNRIGIHLYSSKGNLFSNNTCLKNEDYGIYLYMYSTQNVLTRNNCSFNEIGEGICILESWNNTLSENICNNNSIGINLEKSEKIIVMNNICMWNHYLGISLSSSHNNTITNNTYSNNIVNGIFLSLSIRNILTNNICSKNSINGIRLSQSTHNILLNNTFTRNDYGIYLMGYSPNNTVHYNNIFNNTFYGMNVTDNNGYAINATHNYWGHLSGPFHPTYNPHGQGDNITDYVLFEPWLDEYGNLVYLHDEPDDDSDPEPFILSILLIILACLFVALYGVIRLPKDSLTRKRIQPPVKPVDEVWETTDIKEIKGKLLTCEYCDKVFEIPEKEQALRVPCPQCGKNTKNV